MKGHVLRPLYVVLALVALTFAARAFVVPPDFGAHEKGYMYGWYRKGNEAEWKAFKVKHQTRSYCEGCHTEEYSLIMKSPHGIINCENCHGPARDHPEAPLKLGIDKSRALCLRCHGYLPYKSTGREMIKGISPEEHNPDVECVSCHSPHNPLGGLS